MQVPDTITPTEAYGIISRLLSDDWRLYHVPTGFFWSVAQAKTALRAVEDDKVPTKLVQEGVTK